MIRQMLKGDAQQIETCNGCPNNCEYCYEEQKLTVFNIPEITKNYVHILDMNFLYQLNVIERIRQLGSQKVNNKVIYYELVCGLDHRRLTQEIANELKANRFIKPRIAWDYEFGLQYKIKDSLEILKRAKYKPKEISVFVLANWKIPYEECLRKLDLLKIWNVKINDCCYDNGYPKSREEFYDPKGRFEGKRFWEYDDIVTFRSKSRKHNQLVLFGIDPEFKKEAREG